MFMCDIHMYRRNHLRPSKHTASHVPIGSAARRTSKRGWQINRIEIISLFSFSLFSTQRLQSVNSLWKVKKFQTADFLTRPLGVWFTKALHTLIASERPTVLESLEQSTPSRNFFEKVVRAGDRTRDLFISFTTPANCHIIIKKLLRSLHLTLDPGRSRSNDFWIYNCNASVVVARSVFQSRWTYICFQNTLGYSWHCIFYNAVFVTHDCRIGSSIRPRFP
jgi:hypothetical protein